MRKPGSKKARTLNREQQISVIAQEKMKLATFYSIIGGDEPLIGKLWEYVKTQYI